MNLGAPRSEGAGNAGRPLRPQPCVQKIKARKQVTTVTPEHRHSPRNGFNGFLRALPGDRAFLSPSPRNAKHCRELTPASGRQDHTISPSASNALVLRAKASTASRAQRFVTIAKRPSRGGGMRIAIFLFLPGRQAKFGKSEINLRSKPTPSTSKIGQSVVPRLPRNRASFKRYSLLSGLPSLA